MLARAVATYGSGSLVDSNGRQESGVSGLHVDGVGRLVREVLVVMFLKRRKNSIKDTVDNITGKEMRCSV